MNPLLNPIFLARIAKSYILDVNRVKRSTEEQLKKYQNNQLKKIVRYADSVPLYNKKFKEVKLNVKEFKGFKDLEKIPIVTKKDFRASTTQDLLPKNADPEKYSVVSTSGSTGKPVTLYSDPYTVFYTFIGFIRVLREHNLSWYKNKMAIIADLSPDSAEDAYFSRTAVPNLKTFFSLKNMKIFNVNEKPETLLQQIDEFNPEFLGGYPGIIKILAILTRQGHAKHLSPNIIATSGSIVDELTKQTIQNAFDAQLFDMYGATECSPIAFQCREGHYHINTDFALMEYMDPKKKKDITGDGGNIIVTRLFGRGTPVIRYSGISDLIEPSDKKTNCGINTPTIDHIGGRQVDSIVLPNGDIIPPSSFTGIPHKVMHKFNTDKILQFQIIQQSRKEIDILIVIDEQLRNIGPKITDIFNEIKKQYEKKVGQKVKINVKEVDKIKAIRAGSSTPPPVVISKVNIQ